MHFRINVYAFHAFVSNVIKKFRLKFRISFFFVLEQMYEGSIAKYGVPECDEAPPTVRTTRTRVRPSASQSRDHEWCLDKLVTEIRIKVCTSDYYSKYFRSVLSPRNSVH